jgi:hypothetical protein|tara:strand:+ start:1118 stop:1468 length:351 start_codon:yes stop_codon:yes gene_type:complete
MSTDFPIAGSGSGNNIVATTPSDGWVISPESGGTLGEHLILRLVANGSGDTFTVTQGDRYPAQRVDLGALTLTLAASDVEYVSLETSRFLQNDGTIIITATDSGSVLTAMAVPKAG